MWLKIKTIKWAIIKTIIWIIVIILYNWAMNLLSSLKIDFIQIWINNKWNNLESLNLIIYTIIALRIISAWSSGAAIDIAQIIGFTLIYIIFLGSVIGIKITSTINLEIKIGTLPIYLIYALTYAIKFVFDFFEGFKEFKEFCMRPIGPNNIKGNIEIDL